MDCVAAVHGFTQTKQAMSFITGYQSDNRTGGSGQNGAVFITDITPQAVGNIGGKVFASDGRVLTSCVADTDLIRVHVLAITGHTHFQPVVTVEGMTVPLSEDEDQGVWFGTIDIDKAGSATISASHEDGATHVCQIISDAGPQVVQAIFEGGYPASQSELKEGDLYQLRVDSDTPMVRIEVLDSGAASSQVFDFAATTTKTVTVTIANRGNSAQALGAQLRCMNANGSFGSVFATSSQGTIDGVHTLVLNNLHPQVTVGVTNYPAGQQALKDTETATVNHSASNYDSISYQSHSGQLLISNPATFEPAKAVARLNGGYNVAIPNLTITAQRTANGAATIAQVVVQIADDEPQLSVVLPASRLRSGGAAGTNAVAHTLTIASDQRLLAAPQITAPAATLQGTATDTGNQQTFTQVLSVHDSDPKGSFDFTLLSATNLAGRTVTNFTGNKTYVLGGFVQRVLTIPAFAFEVSLGTAVSDTSGLVASDKDLAPMAYQADFTDNAKTYTITGPSGVPNPSGNLLRWTDAQAVNNNTTGLATITIEEQV